MVPAQLRRPGRVEILSTPSRSWGGTGEGGALPLPPHETSCEPASYDFRPKVAVFAVMTGPLPIPGPVILRL
jgi:hypothetical protein